MLGCLASGLGPSSKPLKDLAFKVLGPQVHTLSLRFLGLVGLGGGWDSMRQGLGFGVWSLEFESKSLAVWVAKFE